MDFNFSFSFLSFIILLLFFILKPKATAKKLPPGPRKLPIIGNIHNLVGSLPHHALKDLAKKHGPIMHLQLGEVSLIVVSSAKIAKEVMKTNDIAFAKRPENLAMKIIVYNFADIGFAPYGAYWRQMRKLCTLELLSAKRVRSFWSIREDEVKHMIESIRVQSSSRELPVNLSEKIFSLINHVTCRATLGMRFKDQEALIKLIEEIASFSVGFDVADLFPSLKFIHFLSGMGPKLEKLHRKIDKILNNIINEKMLESEKGMDQGDKQDLEEDLLAVLLRLQSGGALETPITLNNIKATLLDIFTAGTDTSSATIEWAISEMIRNPQVMVKAQAEVRQALEGKEKVDENDIEGLSYLKLVIKETLRLHPPLPLLLPRECREECEIDGYKIPIKTKVIINAWAIGTDPEYWDDAENFIPERFYNSSNDFKGNDFNYLPFGAGRRMCPGISFGLANIELPLAQLLYHFNWDIPRGMKREDLDMGETQGTNVKRKGCLYLIATPHSPSDD